jgi:hypothetical protein
MPRGRRRKTSGDELFKSSEWAGWALAGLEREITQTKERLALLNEQAAKLRGRLGTAGGRTGGGGAAASSAATPKARRRTMSAEGRKRISEMMKKRWVEAKKKNKNRL